MKWQRRFERFALVVAASAAWPGGARGAAPEGGFRFLDARSQVAELALEPASAGRRVSWPGVAGSDWDTALLGIRIEPAANTDAGTAPWIEINGAGIAARQYFDAGDRGLRWLNLSPWRGQLRAGATLDLVPNGLVLGEAVATLRLFAARPDLARPLLVLAPHPDDAEIAAFGVYAGRNATIVTVTSGNAGDPNYEAVFTDLAELYRFKGHLRLIDSITVPWQGAVPPERCFNLGYFDARLAEMHQAPKDPVPEMFSPNTDVGVYRRENLSRLLPTGPRRSTFENLVEDLVSVLRRVKPAIVIAPHPQLDSHSDHQFTTVALAAALERWRRPATILLYTNHASANRYPFGPAGTLQSVPPPTESEVVLDRVYSHPLDPELQRRKLFALESMHDLRFPPSRQYQLALGEGRALAPEKPGPAPDVTYLRRGPQVNELFYVYDRETLRRVIEPFLASSK